MGRYIVRSGVVSLVPSLLIGAALAGTGILTEENAPQNNLNDPAVILFAFVVFAPIFESFVMAAGLYVFSFLTRRPLRLAAMSAVVWGLLHSLIAPIWGLTIAWPFFVFSCAYLAWRRRAWWRGMAVAISIHAFQNFFPSLIVAFAP
jgi:membrane protease YdiL (CAAX protease family)